MTSPRVDKQSQFQKSPAGRLIATRAYARNMALMRAWKETHRCADCGCRQPHYLMEFESAKKGEWSISHLAGSRCAPAVLEAAMKKTALYCATCKRTRNFKHAKL